MSCGWDWGWGWGWGWGDSYGYGWGWGYLCRCQYRSWCQRVEKSTKHPDSQLTAHLVYVPRPIAVEQLVACHRLHTRRDEEFNGAPRVLILNGGLMGI